MNTLRLFRNLAVLFILVMAFLALRPGVGVLRAATTIKGCVGAVKSGVYLQLQYFNRGSHRDQVPRPEELC